MPDPEPKVDEKKDASADFPESVTKVLEELKVKMDGLEPKKPEAPAASTAPSWQDQREDYKKRMGYSEEQMRAHEELALKQNAPVVENLGWMRLEKKSDIESYRKEIEQELAIYPQERRTPDIMEKIYYFVKGKHADSQPPPKKEPPPAGAPKERIRSGPGYTGNEPDLGGGEGAGAADEEKLSEVEEFVANKLGVSPKEYARSKKVGREVWQMKPQDNRQFLSSADLELKRLMTRKG